MKILFFASFFLLTLASPVVASVYALELSNGSWRVTKYDDGNPRFKLTYVDTAKTVSERRTRPVKDYSSRERILTRSGQLKMQELQKKDIEWRRKPLDIPGASEYATYGSYYCGASGRVCAPRGTVGRPLEPEMTEGIDFNYKYKYKNEVYYVKVPNPGFGDVTETVTVYSERAKKPGGIPFVGSKEVMDAGEFNDYYYHLCGSMTDCR